MDNEYFITKENVGMLKLAKEAKTILVRPILLIRDFLKRWLFKS